MAYLMRSIDPAQSTYGDDIQETFDKLLNVDPMRKNYYKDMSKSNIT